ncbi:MAG: hypothetical protein ACI8PZ_001828 [Myxococcota bacterium]|jgi:hypothetical protein
MDRVAVRWTRSRRLGCSSLGSHQPCLPDRVRPTCLSTNGARPEGRACQFPTCGSSGAWSSRTPVPTSSTRSTCASSGRLGTKLRAHVWADRAVFRRFPQRRHAGRRRRTVHPPGIGSRSGCPARSHIVGGGVQATRERRRPGRHPGDDQRDRGSQHPPQARPGGIPRLRAGRPIRAAGLREWSGCQGGPDVHPGPRAGPPLARRDGADRRCRGSYACPGAMRSRRSSWYPQTD